jgi:hypothetical protein
MRASRASLATGFCQSGFDTYHLGMQPIAHKTATVRQMREGPGGSSPSGPATHGLRFTQALS